MDVMNKKNERGMALISAIIIIALLAIMSGTLMQMSYLAYTRKVTERRSTETFYTAEAALDTVKTVLQNTVAEAVLTAQDETQFTQQAFGTLFGMSATEYKALKVGSKADEEAVKNLRDYLYARIIADTNGNDKTDKGIYKGQSETTYKAGLTSIDDGGNGGSFDIDSVIMEDGAVRIKGVKIEFVNNEGYTATITTDVIIAAPEYAMKKMDKYPVSSYTMFAGGGGLSKVTASNYKAPGQINTAQYVHQEGNMYCGTMEDGSTALLISGDTNGSNYFSIGGENIVLNGDIKIEKGCTLIFTGGDGKNSANIQVNGTIYMEDGATLLLNSNVFLRCMDIQVKDTYAGDLGYKDYTGLNGEPKVSQFFPVTEASMASKAGTAYSQKFDKNQLDVAGVIAAAGGISNSMTADPRANAISAGKGYSGIYVLKSNRNASGWTDRINDAYYRVQKTGTTYSAVSVKNADESIDSGVYSGNLIVGYDPELEIRPQVLYAGKSVDAEFAKLVNLQMVYMYRDYTNSNLKQTAFKNYRSSDAAKTVNNSFTTKKWSELKNDPLLNNSNLVYHNPWWPDGDYSIHDEIDWDHIKTSGDTLMPSGEEVPLLGLRELRIPTATVYGGSTATAGYQDAELKIELSGVATAYTPNILFVGSPNNGTGVVNTTKNKYDIVIAWNKLDVHVTDGEYVGMYMSADQVYFGQSHATSRGVSLLEMMKTTKENPWLDGAPEAPASNQVRQALDKLSASWINNTNYKDPENKFNMKSGEAAFNLFDNIFNGGVNKFWTQPDTNSETNKVTNDADNEDHELIQVDDWKKE